MSSLLNRIYGWLGIRSQSKRVLLLSGEARRVASLRAVAPPKHVMSTPEPAPLNVDAKRKALHAAFNSSRPVDAAAELAGREQEIATLVATVFDEEAHALIHGARGSGKTSLARVFGTQADQRGIVTIYFACDAIGSFAALLGPYLPFIPAMSVAREEQAGFRQRLNTLGSAFGPRELVSVLAEVTSARLLFILDEFDRITDRALQEDVATFMKLLSDARVPLQLIIVGIAGNVNDLIELHPSLRRHLVAIGLRRIGDDSVRSLIAGGSQRSGVVFDTAATRLIEKASAGSPYHVRLFCHQAGLAALARSATMVDEAAALQGLAAATRRWASLNQEDSALFDHLAREPAARATLTQIAVQAAIDDGFTQAPGAVSHGLDDALMTDGRQLGRTLFRDTLAPQFLIATLILAERRQGDGTFVAGDLS
ncbi:ATP-binding protein [Sphingomonas sp. PB2P19]|uniref:ATP-binding protein n=1 Tax=Sphingomonas rhamnosi TaxID=3096156 RepID=UPI002FCBC96D